MGQVDGLDGVLAIEGDATLFLTQFPSLLSREGGGVDPVSQGGDEEVRKTVRRLVEDFLSLVLVRDADDRSDRRERDGVLSR